MSDFHNKKYIMDENNNPKHLEQAMPVKYKLALDELGYCVGCVEVVVKCAVDVMHNLTDTQAEHVLEQLSALSDSLNSTYDLSETSKKELEFEKQKFEIEKTAYYDRLAKLSPYFKVGSALVGGAIASVTTYLGIQIF